MRWVPEEVIERLRGGHQLGIFLRLDIDPPLRLWLGLNDIPIGIESVDEEGAVYLGAGRLNGVPDLEVLINGVADRIEFQLAGIDADQASMLDFDDVDLRGREVHVGITVLDDYHQPVSPIIPIWNGAASFVTEYQPAAAGTETPSITIGLSVGSGVTTRDRISAALWSHAQQLALWAQFFPTPELQAANPPDDFCKGTARLARGVQPSWPRF